MATIIFLLSFGLLSFYLTSITALYFLPLWIVLSYGLAFVVVLLFYMLNFPLVLILPAKHPYKAYLMKSISRLLNRFILGLKVEVTGIKHIPMSGPLVVYANHKSYTDGFSVLDFFPRPLTLAPKKSVLSIPLLKGWLRAYDVFPINRSNPRETAKDLDKAVETVKNGHALLIFPEGQIKNRLKDEVEAMKPGAFKVALRAEAQILIIRLDGNDLVRKRFPWKRSYRKLTILEPIAYDVYKDMTTQELSQFVMDKINFKEN